MLVPSIDAIEGATTRTELRAVADAAGRRLRAEVDQDVEAAQNASGALLKAATEAMAAGCSLTEIARAEGQGKQTVQEELGGSVLKLVNRTANQAKAAKAAHHEAIARATRLGLSTREIAQAAGITHGTVRAITNRLAAGQSGEDVDVSDADEEFVE